MGTRQNEPDWLEAGLARHRQNDLIGAVNFYQQALQATPDAARPRHYLGLALYQLGQEAIGLHMMEQSLSALADDAQIQLNYCKALQAMNTEAALRHLQTLEQRMPADPDIALHHAELLRSLSRPGEAIALLERLHAGASPSAETLHLLALLHYRENHLDEATRCHEEAVRLKPSLAKECRISHARPAARTEKSELVCPLRDLHVIDDFLEDVAAYRIGALGQAFRQTQYEDQNYPGMQTDGMPCQEIMERISTILRRPIKTLSPDNGVYRLSFGHSTARTDIHVDNETGESGSFYAAVLYLNPPRQCQGGTSFWRHLPTGWEKRPSQGELRAAGYADFKAFQKRWLPNHRVLPFGQLKEQREAWQAVLEVPMRQNRLIIYRGDYFHSITDVFGATPEDARLVQLFFFEVLPDESAVIAPMEAARAGSGR